MDRPLDELMKDPQTAGLLGDRAALDRLLRSPDTRKLLDLLHRQAGAGLHEAADQALHGDPSALSALVDRLRSGGEGEALLERVRKAASRP